MCAGRCAGWVGVGGFEFMRESLRSLLFYLVDKRCSQGADIRHHRGSVPCAKNS